MQQAHDAAQSALIVTIDTEGDDLWSSPREVTTRNAAYLPRFQAICERFGLKPVYLTNWEMAHSPEFRAFARDVLDRRSAEIGMHLHAWDTPPLLPLTADDLRYHPYLIEYADDVMREKAHRMTAALEDTFQVKMRSHRAGRWAFDSRYARLLEAEGYCADCSVTPHVSWRATPGDPAREGGSDYSQAPEAGYWLSADDVTKPGKSALLEVPVTIAELPRPALVARLDRMAADQVPLVTRALRRLAPQYAWLRPNGRNLRHMLTLVRVATEQRRDHLEFMLHSSELMPGGSPTFRTKASIERLYADLERLFAAATAAGFRGQTLAEYHEAFVAREDAAPAGRTQ